MSSVLVGGCISIVSGRDSRPLGPNEVKISHRPRFDLDYNLVTRGGWRIRQARIPMRSPLTRYLGSNSAADIGD